MMKKKVIVFNRLPKQEYQKPTIEVEEIQYTRLLMASDTLISTCTNLGDDDDFYFEGSDEGYNGGAR